MPAAAAGYLYSNSFSRCPIIVVLLIISEDTVLKGRSPLAGCLLAAEIPVRNIGQEHVVGPEGTLTRILKRARARALFSRDCRALVLW